ncbi:MAG TPA: Arc family DNA-binding protein [Gemmatimonadaceae bacterium]|nr:Arc family DNA-binding protein [Gemmatimonadaceae bacterium]
MAERKSFLLRADRELMDAVQRWANDELRSLNGQIEFLLRRALQREGRLRDLPESTDSENPVDAE